jgi:hypothetical protein
VCKQLGVRLQALWLVYGICPSIGLSEYKPSLRDAPNDTVSAARRLAVAVRAVQTFEEATFVITVYSRVPTTSRSIPTSTHSIALSSDPAQPCNQISQLCTFANKPGMISISFSPYSYFCPSILGAFVRRCCCDWRAFTHCSMVRC